MSSGKSYVPRKPAQFSMYFMVPTMILCLVSRCETVVNCVVLRVMACLEYMEGRFSCYPKAQSK